MRLPLSVFASFIGRDVPSCVGMRRSAWRRDVALIAAVVAWVSVGLQAQVGDAAAARAQAARFVAQRGGVDTAAGVSARARAQMDAMLLQPRAGSLTASWQAVGPASVLTASYGVVTGRVTAVAFDPSDATGNTVYVGTTGGGVWKSTNAAGAVATVTFAPLTDTLPVFASSSGGCGGVEYWVTCGAAGGRECGGAGGDGRSERCDGLVLRRGDSAVGGWWSDVDAGEGVAGWGEWEPLVPGAECGGVGVELGDAVVGGGGDVEFGGGCGGGCGDDDVGAGALLLD